MDYVIELEVIENRMRLTKPYKPIVAGNKNYKLLFHFDEVWQNCKNKRAIFIVQGNGSPVEFTGNECSVPVMPNAPVFLVSLIASTTEGEVYATAPLRLVIEKNPSYAELNKEDPYKSYYAKLRGIIDDFEKGNIFSKNSDFATESDHANSADHATNSDQALNSEHATDADHALNSDYAEEAGHSLNSDYAEDAEHSLNSDHAKDADHSLDSDHATNSDHSLLADSANEAEHAENSNNAKEAEHSVNSDKAEQASEATHASKADDSTNAVHAENSDYATEAGHAESADSATISDKAKTAESATNADHAESATISDKAKSADSATHADSATTAENAKLADKAKTADSATHADSATTATSAERADSATHADSATRADSATSVDSAAHADSATTAESAKLADKAKTADSATHADSATTANSAKTADSATSATHADSATSADKAKTADSATSATYADSATSADKAKTADSATSATRATTAASADYATEAGLSRTQVSKTGDEDISGFKNFKNQPKYNGADLLTSTAVSNPNLLINGDFKINQRGATTYSTVNKYTVDRWKLISGSVQVVSDGIILNGSISQTLDKALTGTLTSSVDQSNGVVMATFTASSSGGVFKITASNVKVSWAKLEVGPVATAFAPKPTSQELVDCKYYFQKFYVHTWFIKVNDEIALNMYGFSQMRVTPSLVASEFTSGGKNSIRGGGKYVDGYDWSITSAKLGYLKGNQLQIRIGTKNVNIPMGYMCWIELWEDFTLDAEIY